MTLRGSRKDFVDVYPLGRSAFPRDLASWVRSFGRWRSGASLCSRAARVRRDLALAAERVRHPHVPTERRREDSEVALSQGRSLSSPCPMTRSLSFRARKRRRSISRIGSTDQRRQERDLLRRQHRDRSATRLPQRTSDRTHRGVVQDERLRGIVPLRQRSEV